MSPGEFQPSFPVKFTIALQFHTGNTGKGGSKGACNLPLGRLHAPSCQEKLMIAHIHVTSLLKSHPYSLFPPHYPQIFATLSLFSCGYCLISDPFLHKERKKQ